MKQLIAGLFLFTSLLASANELDLTIDHYMEEIPVPSDFDTDIAKSTVSYPDDGALLELDKILNLGARIWKIIEKNQPVLNVKHQYANALPKGVKSSEDLAGFSSLNRRAFHVWGKNLYGVRVYDVQYVAVHRHGGSYNGVGQYVENAAVIPTSVEVSWGYTLNYGVTQVNVVNVGTDRQPIGSVLLETELSVSTVMKKTKSIQAFEFRGDSGAVLVTQ